MCRARVQAWVRILMWCLVMTPFIRSVGVDMEADLLENVYAVSMDSSHMSDGMSPIYAEKLKHSVMALDQLTVYYAGVDTPAFKPSAVEPQSAESGCGNSGCVVSFCKLSNCAGSACLLSGCGGSACGGSVCLTSACASACLGSFCAVSTCTDGGWQCPAPEPTEQPPDSASGEGC